MGSRDHVSEPTPRDGPGTAEGITAPRRAIREIGGEERRDLGAGLPDLDRGAAAGGAEGGDLGEQIDFSGGEERRTVIGDPAYTTWLHLHVRLLEHGPGLVRSTDLDQISTSVRAKKFEHSTNLINN